MPTWVEQKNLGDLGLNDSGEQVEIPVRYPWKFYKKGRQDTELTFTMNYHPTEAFHQYVRDHIRTGDKAHFAVSEGNIASSDYFHAWWILTGPEDMSLDAPATFAVSARLSIDFGTGEEPEYVNTV
jgi:hypothetical protein